MCVRILNVYVCAIPSFIHTKCGKIFFKSLTIIKKVIGMREKLCMKFKICLVSKRNIVQIYEIEVYVDIELFSHNFQANSAMEFCCEYGGKP